MKLTFILWIVAFLQVSAASYAQKVNIRAKNAQLEDIVNQLRNQTGYDFLCNSEIFEGLKPITLIALNKDLSQVLDECLSGLPLKYKINNKTVVITRKEEPVKKVAPPNVTGRVTDEKGEGLPGVNIYVKGSTGGAVSAVDGTYTIKVPNEKSILVFSLLGFASREIMIAGRSTLNVVLKEQKTELSEIVVTALGIKREEKALGYAISTIKGEELTDALSNNWIDGLSGKVAGLNLIRSNSGPVGSTKVILRGENNLTGDNEALIVVDGVVLNQGSGRRTAIGGESVIGTNGDNMPADYGSGIDDINPEDIESINILKGPGASALYGQRGANGAIIITTKSGSPRKKGLGVTINSNTSFESVNRWPDYQYEYGQGLDGAAYYSYKLSEDGLNTGSGSSAYGPRFDGQLFYQYDPVTRGKGAVRTPWIPYGNQFKDYFNTGQTYTNSISLDGGTDRTTARFSATNVVNKWVVPNTGYDRNSIALSVNSKINDKLQITSKVNYSNKSSDNLPSVGYGNQSIMYWTLAWVPNGDINWLKDYWETGQEGVAIQYPFSTQPQNPYAIAYEYLNGSNRDGLTGNIQANYNLTKELSVQVRTSMDMSYEQRSQKRPYDAGTRYQRGSYRTQSIFSQEVSSDFLVKYDKKVNKDFNLSVSVGGSMLKNKYNRDEVRADSLTYPGIYSMSNAAGSLETLPYKSRYAINSFYGLSSFEYKKFLYLDLTARQDWNSVLANPERSENSGFFYPSASMSFVVSELFKLPAYISFAKLRASSSMVGSGGVTPYLTAYNYPSAGSYYNGSLENPSLLANPDLRPLKTISHEIGGDLRFFKSRLGLDFAFYSGNTKDQILQRVVDRSSGYARTLINAGKVRNQGMELSLNTKPLVNKNGLNWNSTITFSANKNTVVELADSAVVLQTGPAGGGQIVVTQGGSMGDLYGKGYVRSPDGQVVYDANTGFALISSDVTYLGNTIPKWKMGFNNQFRYKQFRLNVLFDAQYGAIAHSMSYAVLSRSGKTKNTLPGRYNGIIGNGVVQNPDGSYRKNDVIALNIDEYYRSHYGTDNAEGSTYSTNFIKFREARLDYTLPTKMTVKMGLQRATIGVYGRNLFIWSKWPVFDPEFGTLNGTDINRGFEIGQFPSTRTLGINLVVGI